MFFASMPNIDHDYEDIIYQLDGETNTEYKMLLDYLGQRNIPAIVKIYDVSTRTIYNIKQKNKWNERIDEYEKKENNIFIKASFRKMLDYNYKRKNNLIDLAYAIQIQIDYLHEYLAFSPEEIKDIYNQDKTRSLDIIRTITRAILDLQKLDEIAREKLKDYGIDLSPEFISQFEKEEILGEHIVEYEDLTETIKRKLIGTPINHKDVETDDSKPIRPKKHKNLEEDLKQAEDFIEKTKKILEELDIKQELEI